MPGRVRTGPDPGADLRVVLDLSDATVALRTATVELGSWDLGAVTITRVGRDRFGFVADGEQLVFLPDDPALLERLEIVTAAAARPKARRRRRSSKRNDSPAPGTTSDPSRQLPPAAVAVPAAAPPAPPPAPVERVKARKEQPPRDPRPRRTRPPRTSTSRPRRHAAKTRRVPKPRRVPRPERAPRRDRDRAPSWWAKTARPQLAAATATSRKWAGRRSKLGWLWLLDHLRQTDIYVLDRIPVVTDEMRLEPDHEHVYEERTAGAGLVRRVCACGKVIVAAD